MNRTHQAELFISAFFNPIARTYVRDLLIESYTAAILNHHPHHPSLDSNQVHEKCCHLVDHIFERIDHLNGQADKLFALFTALSRASSPCDAIWFDEFITAYQHYKHHRKLENRLRQLEPFLAGTRYCDIGCGGGDLVVYLKTHHPQFTQAAGIDVIDWRSESIKDRIGFQALDLTRSILSNPERYDTLTCLAVLHHIDHSDRHLDIFLDNLKKSLNPGGHLIVEEDVILPEKDIRQDESVFHQLETLRGLQPQLDRFLAFPELIQRDIIVLIDFMANCLVVGVPEMAFPCGFRSLTQWKEIFQAHGFKLKEIKVAGFVPGNFNRSSHLFFILTDTGSATR